MSSVLAGRNAWVAAAVSAAGALVIGYCIYFDAKRRRDPHFKKNLRESKLINCINYLVQWKYLYTGVFFKCMFCCFSPERKRIRQEKTAEKTGPGVIPDLRDQEAVQRFFLGAVQRGEDLLAGGDVDGAVESLGAAIAVCGHPQQLLHILQQTLPPQVFHLLLTRLPMIGQVRKINVQFYIYLAPVLRLVIYNRNCRLFKLVKKLRMDRRCVEVLVKAEFRSLECQWVLRLALNPPEFEISL